MDKLDNIKEKIEFLKKHDTSLAVFGAKQHQYNINSVLSEDDILRFENSEQVHLPESYRNYLKYIGNGGAGPAYGLYTLDDARNGAGWHPPVENLNDRKGNSDSPGELLISHNGCGLFTWLRVSEPGKGELWHDGRSNDMDPCCINEDFLDWYNYWLDSAFFETGFIAHVGYEALQLGQQGEFEKALALFKLGADIKYNENYTIKPDVKTQYLQLLCNVLYFLQHDNTGLPINTNLNYYFLEKCMAFGEENPAIYFNAACVYNEMKDFANVSKCVELAEQFFDGYEEMIGLIKQEPLFAEYREYAELV